MTDEKIFLEKNPEINQIFSTDTNFPKSILKIRQSVSSIYHLGHLKNFDRGISIVGTRDCSDDGKKFAVKLGQLLGKEKILVISGLAKGIDSYAHKGCLDSDGITMAVLPWFHKLYPSNNQNLLDSIIQKGCAISEILLMPQENPRYLFLKRNEIMTSLSDAVVVVESKNSGGALYTAKFAIKNNVPVIKCKTKTNDKDLINGHKHFLEMGAIECNDADDILDIIKNLKNYTSQNSIERFF